MRQITFFLMLLAFSGFASARESFYEPDGDNLKKFLCEPGEDYSYFKWGKLETLVTPHLSISTWDESFGKSAENLGLAVDISKNVGLPLFKEFEKAVVEAEGFKTLKYDASITREFDVRYDTCTSQITSSDDMYGKFQTCRAKAANIIETIYGQRMGKVFCNIKLKGEEFPVLVSTSCSISYGGDFKYNRAQELAFFDYLSPEVGEKATIQLFRKYADQISKIVSIGKKCG